MLQILLIFISISVASCQTNCAGFTNTVHDASLQDKLDGDYLVVYTTARLLQCERIRWTVGPNNNITALIKSANGCCVRVDNFDTSNPDYLLHDITPVTQCSYLQSTERTGLKLISVKETVDNRCLFIHFCHNSRSGLLVECREPPEVLLLAYILLLVKNLLSVLLLNPPTNLVNQSDCIFGNTCFV